MKKSLNKPFVTWAIADRNTGVVRRVCLSRQEARNATLTSDERVHRVISQKV